jgi:hypothetical protein
VNAESLRKIVETARLQIARRELFDADLTLELALREISGGNKCPKCRGSGHVFVALSGMEECQMCRGTGRQT